MPEPGQPFNPWRALRGPLIPYGVLQIPTITDGAKICYGVLKAIAGEHGRAHPSMRRIASHMAVTPRSVLRYLLELENAALIRRVSGRAQGVQNGYEFLWHNCFVGNTRQGEESAKEGTTALSQGGTTALSQGGTTALSQGGTTARSHPYKETVSTREAERSRDSTPDSEHQIHPEGGSSDLSSLTADSGARYDAPRMKKGKNWRELQLTRNQRVIGALMEDAAKGRI